MSHSEETAMYNVNNTPAQAERKKKNICSRLLALVLTVAPIVCLLILSVPAIFASEGGYVLQKTKLLDVFLAFFKADGLAALYEKFSLTVPETTKLFKIPMLSGAADIYGKIYGIALWLLPVAWVLSVFMMIIGLCSGKKAPAMVRSIAFVNLVAVLVYTLAIFYVSLAAEITLMTMVKDTVIYLAIAAAMLVFYTIYCFRRTGKTAFWGLVLFLFSLGYAVCTVFALKKCPAVEEFVLTKSLYKWIFLGALLAVLVSAFVSLFRMSSKKGYLFDIFRYLIGLLLAGAVLVLTFVGPNFKTFENLNPLRLWMGIAAGIAFLQILICAIARKVRKKAKKENAEIIEKAPKEKKEKQKKSKKSKGEPEETPEEENGYTPIHVQPQPESERTEIRDAIQLGEKPLPEYRPAPTLLDNGTYGSASAPSALGVAPSETNLFDNEEEADTHYKGKDVFIATLSSKEREQFMDIFIGKSKGTSGKLPDYQIGGDNTKFFRQFFIHLGLYRDKVPDGLLAKMYKFSVK